MHVWQSAILLSSPVTRHSSPRKTVHFRYAREDSQKIVRNLLAGNMVYHTNAPKLPRLAHVLARLGSTLKLKNSIALDLY